MICRTLANVTGWLSAGVILSSGHLPLASDEDINSSGGSDIHLVDPARGDWERSLAG
jgi:hypothetical protein